jgi:hypothetical protein
MGDETYTMYRSHAELLEKTVRLLRKAGLTLARAREGVRPIDPWTGDGPERARLHDRLGTTMATLADARADLGAIAAGHAGRRERREASLVRTTWAEWHAEVQATARGEDEEEG